MCKNTGTYYCFNIILVVVVTFCLFEASDDIDKLQNEIDNLKTQGSDSRFFSCTILCPSYPIQMGN